MNEPIQQLRVWTYINWEKTRKIEAWFESCGIGAEENEYILLRRSNGNPFRIRLYWLSQEDKDFLREEFHKIGFSFDTQEFFRTPNTDPTASIVYFRGTLLVNRTITRGVTFYLDEDIDQDIELLKKMPNLEYIRLCGRSTRFVQSFGKDMPINGALEKLSQWDGVPKLYSVLTGLTDQGIQAIRKMKRLEMLCLQFSDLLSDQGIACVGELRSLKSLILDRCKGLTKNAWNFLSTLSQLEYLYLDQIFSDEALTHIGKMQRLRRLELLQTDWDTEEGVSDHGILQLGELRNVERLLFSQLQNITNEGLAVVEKMQKLKNFKIYGCSQITDSGFTAFRNSTELENLTFCDSPNFIGIGLKHLENLSRLKTLNLRNCSELTDEGFSHLPHLNALRGLSLEGCSKITNKTLDFFQSFSNLQLLNVIDCQLLTSTGLERLQNTLPGLKILVPEDDVVHKDPFDDFFDTTFAKI